MPKLNSSEQDILKEIDKWKAAEPSIFTKASGLMSRPLEWASDNLIPEEVKNKSSVVTDKIISRLQDMSKWTVKEEEVLKATREYAVDSETIIELKNASIHDLDNVSEDFVNLNTKIAAAEGFGAGLIGWAGMIADLPALFTIACRMCYQVSLSYGYAVPKEDEDAKQRNFEIGYMLRIIKVASAANKVLKTSALLELKEYEAAHRLEKEEELAGDFLTKQVSKGATINVSRVLVNVIVKQIFARSAITKIPGFGAFMTAGFNYTFMNEVGKNSPHAIS